jgi:Transposase C of IS166 homeodomain/zinc-finger binding domain of transposase IS66
MVAAHHTLPDLNELDPTALKALILSQHEQLLSRDNEIEHLKLLIAKLRRMQFGRKSEKLDRQIEQLELRLDELQTTPAENNAASHHPVVVVPVSNVGVKPARRPLPEHLPRETRSYLPKQEACPDCGGKLKPLGEDVSEILEYMPARFKVIRQVRPKLACSCCERIVQAAAPSRPIERGVAGPGLLAHVLVSKYCDHCVSRTHRQQWRCGNCVRDEGGPFEVCNQEWTSNYRELLSLRAMVVNVAEKAGQEFRQVSFRETSVSEPSMNCRNCTVDVETGDGGRSGISVGGDLKTGPRDIRLEGGVNLEQALAWNVRTCRTDAKGASRVGDPCKAQSTDAGHRGRTARSRDEGVVMTLDRRGCGVQLWQAANW